MFLLIDKPKGISSFKVIKILRKISGEKKIGHGGTLDPNASGLLIVALGRESTRKLGFVLKKSDKEYLAEIFLGEERDTDDATGKIQNISQEQVRAPQNTKSVRDDKAGLNSLPALSKYKIINTLKSFIGEQMQVPPVYSAIKLKGKKAYDLARKGKDVRLKSRCINIYEISVISYKYPELVIKCRVGSGTYIRALARDIGRKLGCGAYLRNLKRTGIGEFRVENAVGLENLNHGNIYKYTSSLF